MIRQPKLAATYARVAQEGMESFYRGAIAREIVESIQAQGGIIDADDLANYEPHLERTARDRLSRLLHQLPSAELQRLAVSAGFQMLEAVRSGCYGPELGRDAAHAGRGLQDRGGRPHRLHHESTHRSRYPSFGRLHRRDDAARRCNQSSGARRRRALSRRTSGRHDRSRRSASGAQGMHDSFRCDRRRRQCGRGHPVARRRFRQRRDGRRNSA